jgi:hypothetical protein
MREGCGEPAEVQGDAFRGKIRTVVLGVRGTMTIYCLICRRHEPANADQCLSCGTALEHCQGSPPKPTTRCVKCGGGTAQRCGDGRLVCGGCGDAVHGVAFKPLSRSAVSPRPRQIGKGTRGVQGAMR